MLSESTWLGAALVLIRIIVAGTLWLTLGGILVLAIREPARRTRACGLSLLGCLLIPTLAMTIPGNLWGPPPVMQIDAAAPVERRTLGDDPRGVHPDSSSNPQPVLREFTNAGVDSNEGDPSTLWMPMEADAPANSVALSAANGIIATSPAEAAFSWWGVGSAAYFFGAGVVGLWYVAGVAGLVRLVRRAGVPAPALESLWQEVRGDDLATTTLRVSAELRQPIACWWRRSLVLLPAGWSDVSHDRIEAALAHEAEHVRHGDFWWWQAANLARIVFWFHPLAWWLRRELRIGQDFLADAAVVRSRKSKVEYAEFLTSSACLELSHTSLVGLGLLGRRSELYRRVAMLLKRERPLELRAPRWWNAALLAGGILALGAVTTMRVIADPAPASIPLPLASRAVDSGPPSPGPIGANVAAPAGRLSDPFAADVQRPGALNPIIPADPVPGTAPGLDLFPPVPAAESGGSAGPPSAAPPPLPEATPVPGSPGTFPGAPPSPSPLPLAPRGTPDVGPLPPGGNGNAASAPRTTATVIRKLAIQNENIEPEPGVAISIVALSDSEGNSWKPDGSRIDPGQGGYGGSAFGAPGMGGSPGGYYPPMGASMMSGPGPGTAAPLSAEARQRSVTLRVQRPLPAGLHLSVDGQSVSRSSSSLPDSKARQITQTAYWPDQQMEGSVGVRFASKTVARELLASNRAGETLANNQGGVEARLGPWKQGSDLQTEILLEGVQPNDPRFVLVAQAVDVDGTTHPGRIEHRQKGSMREYSPDYSSIGMGSEGTGPMAGAMSGGGKGEWQMVFPHLPADRIAQIRLTWHPYAWVIIRNISLEPDHKTTPTAELYIDQSKPPAAPNPVEGPAAPPPNGPSAVLRVVPLQY